jgi:acyl-coenzyme A synthetase/AMP-(fatty) acid ligase
VNKKEKSLDLIDKIASYLDKHPEKDAIIFPTKVKEKKIEYGSISFRELDEQSSYLGGYLRFRGMKKGDRAVVMLPTSLMLYIVITALIKLGVAIVFIDQWLGLKQIENSCKISKPKAFIGNVKANLLRLYSKTFREVPIKLMIRKTGLDGLDYIRKLTKGAKKFTEIERYEIDSPMIVRFTTGNTGVPKGVKRTYGYVCTQLEAISDFWKIKENDVDMPTWPLNVLYNLVKGATTVVPLVSYGRANKVDPAFLVRQIQDCNVTTASGSPFYWLRIVEYCKEKNIKLDRIRLVFIGGGPVSLKLIYSFPDVFPNAKAFVVYGSTEVFPLSWIDMQEIRRSIGNLTQNGNGICVGKPHPNLCVKIIKPTSGPIRLSRNGWKNLELKQGSIGEIIVTGPHVAAQYYGDDGEIFSYNKIIDSEKRIWHRTGDVGYLDKEGRIWLVGRKNNIYRIKNKVFYPLMIESMIDALPEVSKSALVEFPLDVENEAQPLLVIEPVDKKIFKDKKSKIELKNRVISLCKSKNFHVDAVIFRRKIPLDPRHNTKVDYNLLYKMLKP